MRSLTVALVTCLLAVFSPGANADGGVTTGEMMENCQKPDGHIFKTYCYTYIGAVIDIQSIYALADGSGFKAVCFPPPLGARQAAAVFVQWAVSNPTRHHISAATGVVESMAQAFPCRAP